MSASLTHRFVEAVVAESRPGVLHAPLEVALYDFIVCGATGQPIVEDWFDAPAGSNTIVGSARRTSSENAAALNAAAGHALDRDDLHWPSLTHPGSLVWPVVLALGEEEDVPFSLVLRAAAVGYELTARLATALGGTLRTFWHPTTTAGTVGAAVAGALVVAPDDVHVACSAGGHAICVSPALIQVIIERSPTGVFTRAHAARTAVTAARAAAGGLEGLRTGLESERGLFAAVAPDGNPEDVLMPSSTAAITNVAFRPYATTGYAQTAVDAALQLAPVDATEVERIEIVAPAGAAGIAGNCKPTNPVERWWSIPYAVAVCLLSGNHEALESDSPRAREEIDGLLEKSSVTARPGAPDDDLTTDVIVTMGGTRLRASARLHAGHPERPLDDHQLSAKWAAMDPRRTTGQASTLLAACRQAAEMGSRDAMASINQVLLDGGRG